MDISAAGPRPRFWIVRGDAAGDATIFGGKAAALSALVRSGFSVPEFFAIAPDAFNEAGLRAEARSEFARHLTELGSGPGARAFAVRSSGCEEDGAAHSHAGQFLSVLDVAADAVDTAAARVWQSGTTDTIRAYRQSRGLDPEGAAPAIIVQRLVSARAAGVMFSADPVSGRRDRIVISAVEGLGERLVAGDVDGDDYILDGANGAVLESPAHGVLSAADLTALTDLARKVEAARGSPQDMEWAFEGSELYLLQARPITTALRDAPIADPAVTIFDNSNIIESYPGIVSPLTYSFAQYVYARVYKAFVALLGVDAATILANGPMFENMLARVDGRVYYNLINWYRALALLPGFAINRSFMETMMGVGEPLPEAITATIGSEPARGFGLVREYARVGRVAFGLLRQALRLRRTIDAFLARLNRALPADAEAIDSLPLTALAAEYRRIESELLDRWDAPLVNDFLCMIAFGASRKLIERWAGPAGLAYHNDVMIGQGDIISAEPAQRIARMATLASADADLIAALGRGDRATIPPRADIAQEIDAYIAKFGDRCTEELKLESITLREDPRPLMAAIAAASRMQRGPQTAARLASLNTLLPRRPLKRVILSWVLGFAKARVRDRENLRFERTRVFGRARRLFVAIGRQLHAHGVVESPRDVFLLTVSDVLGAIEGFAVDADLKGLIAMRKAELAEAELRPDPPERISVTGAIACGLPRSRQEQVVKSASSQETLRKATGCCAGIVRGRVRVVRDPRTEALAAGDILVARHTDPGWIAVFANAAAIVVERGSLLSHSAIVARELGIPCVVGLAGATEWLATGDHIEVDGGAGTVRKLDG